MHCEAAVHARCPPGGSSHPPLTANTLRDLGEVGEQVAAAVEDAVLAVVHQMGRPAGEGDPRASRTG